MLKPDRISEEGRFDSFGNGSFLYNKKKNHLPAMGWNSWNAFGSGNTEELTKFMADKIIELGLDKLGYSFVILDDGCYKTDRIDGRLSNEEVKFPGGFKALSDYIHEKGLKFGMYNDIGTNLCAGAAVGTCGHEEEDARSYIEWGVDFLKVDNCYYPFDNATFSNPQNAAYSFAPDIRAIRICRIVDGAIVGDSVCLNATTDGRITGERAFVEDDHVTGLGTFDGTGPESSPIGDRSSELIFDFCAEDEGEYSIEVEYRIGMREGRGAWLQLYADSEMLYDDFLEDGFRPDESFDPNASKDDKSDEDDKYEFTFSRPISVHLVKGMNHIRIANHRRQENTLNSYARLLKELNNIKPDHDIIYSACEWGKTHPQNWAYKVCDSWRILNDITFRVGSDGDPGHGAWVEDYTTSVTTQYNKAVIMDEFSGPDKGYNDPDMLMIGMDGLDETQCRTHMTMWCMMNSPLMLGMDLRRVGKGDFIYNIIANKDAISLNQDPLGIQAKRIFSTLAENEPDKEYIRDIDRVDILVKPLADDRFAVSFINVSEKDKAENFRITIDDIVKAMGDKIKMSSDFMIRDIWTGEQFENHTGVFEIHGLKACDNATFIISELV